jgi:hypothetical protein
MKLPTLKVEATMAASDPASLKKISHLGFIVKPPPPSNPSRYVVKKHSFNLFFLSLFFFPKIREKMTEYFLFY